MGKACSKGSKTTDSDRVPYIKSQKNQKVKTISQLSNEATNEIIPVINTQLTQNEEIANNKNLNLNEINAKTQSLDIKESKINQKNVSEQKQNEHEYTKFNENCAKKSNNSFLKNIYENDKTKIIENTLEKNEISTSKKDDCEDVRTPIKIHDNAESNFDVNLHDEINFSTKTQNEKVLLNKQDIQKEHELITVKESVTLNQSNDVKINNIQQSFTDDLNKETQNKSNVLNPRISKINTIGDEPTYKLDFDNKNINLSKTYENQIKNDFSSNEFNNDKDLCQGSILSEIKTEKTKNEDRLTLQSEKCSEAKIFCTDTNSESNIRSPKHELLEKLNLNEGNVTNCSIEVPSKSCTEIKEDSNLPSKQKFSTDDILTNKNILNISPVSPNIKEISPITNTSSNDKELRNASVKIKDIVRKEKYANSRYNYLKLFTKDHAQCNEYIINSKPLLSGTRAKLLAALEKWATSDLQEANFNSKIVVLHGVAGIGKSTVAVEMSRQANNLLGKYFFNQLSSCLCHNRARELILSLLNQLDANLQVRSVSDIDNYKNKFNFGCVKELIDQFLMVELSRHSKENSNYLLIFDGLDELPQEELPSVLEILKHLNIILSEKFRILITADDELLCKLKNLIPTLYSVELKSTSESMSTDLKKYFQENLFNLIDRISLDGAVKVLVDKSEGNFLTADMILDKINNFDCNKKLQIRALDQAGFGIINTLDSLYNDLSSKHGSKEAIELYQKILAVIVLSKESIDKSILFRIDARLDPTKILDILKPIIRISDDKFCVKHYCIIKGILLITQENKLFFNLLDAQIFFAELINNICIELINIRDKKLTIDDYALKRYVYHLIETPGYEKQLMFLLNDLNFAQWKLNLPNVSVDDIIEDYNHQHVNLKDNVLSLSSYLNRYKDNNFAIKEYLERYWIELKLNPTSLFQLIANDKNCDNLSLLAKNLLDKKEYIIELTNTKGADFTKYFINYEIQYHVQSKDLKLLAVTYKINDHHFVELFDIDNAKRIFKPIDISTIDNRRGQILQFLKNDALLFVGSLAKAINVKTSAICTLNFDTSSLELKEKYRIECASCTETYFALGVSTLSYGGRSLNVLVFELGSNKLIKTLDVFLFKFGGSPNFNISCICFANDAPRLCAFSKFSNKEESKLTIWDAIKWDLIVNIDVKIVSPMKCDFVTIDKLIITTMTSNIITMSIDGKIEDCSLNSELDECTKLFYTLNKNMITVMHADLNSSNFIISERYIENLSNFGSTLLFSGNNFTYDFFITKNTLAQISKYSVQFYKLTDGIKISPNIETNATFVNDLFCVNNYAISQKTDEVLVNLIKSHQIFNEKTNSINLKLNVGSNDINIGEIINLDSSISSSINANLLNSYFYDPKSTHTSPKVYYNRDWTKCLILEPDGIHIHDARSNQRMEINSRGDRVEHVSCSTKENLLAVNFKSRANKIHIYDVSGTDDSPSTIQTFELSANLEIAFLLFVYNHPNLMAVAKSSKSDAVETITWSVRSDVPLDRKLYSNVVDCIHFSAASDRLVVSEGGAFKLRNAENTFARDLAQDERASDASTQFSVDGTVLIALYSPSNVARIWNVGNGDVVRDVHVAFLNEHTDGSTKELIGLVGGNYLLVHDVSRRALVLANLSGDVLSALPLGVEMARLSSGRGFSVATKSNTVYGSTLRGRRLRVFRLVNVVGVKFKSTLHHVKSLNS